MKKIVKLTLISAGLLSTFVVGCGRKGSKPTPKDEEIVFGPYSTTTVKNGAKVKKPKNPSGPLYAEFGTFIGWSRYEIVESEDQLWDFDNDVVFIDDESIEKVTVNFYTDFNTYEYVFAADVFNLFGVWKAQGD